MKLVRMLLVCFGVIYLWFGVLKFFPGISPAEHLAGETIRSLTFGQIKGAIGIKLLATLETLIGVLCISGLAPKWTIRLIGAHLMCTFTPIFLFPAEVFGESPFQLTLVGQYIIKNLVFMVALLFIYQPLRKRDDAQRQPQQLVDPSTMQAATPAWKPFHLLLQKAWGKN